MSYKFQLGGYRASGSLTQEGPLTVTSTTADNGSRVSHGHISASHGLSGSSLVVGGTGSLYGIEADGKLAISAFNADWTNAGRTVADGGTFTVAAVSTGGLTYAGTAVTSTGAELNLLDTAVAGTVINSKAVIYGAAGQVNATTVSSSTGMTGSSLVIGAAGTTGTSISNNGTVKSVNLVGTTSVSSSQGITGSSLQMGAYGLTNDGRLSVGTVAGSTGTFSGILKTDDTTDATGKTDGSLQTDGGLSVAKAIYNGTAATLAADSGVVTMGSTTAATISALGVLNVNNATDASNTTDGSLQTDGGLSVAKAIYNGTSAVFAADSGTVTIGAATAAVFTAAGILNVNNATDASNTTDGSLQTDGGLSVAKKVYIGTDLTVMGDATLGNDQADTCTINGATVNLANVPTNIAMALANDSIYFVDNDDGYIKERSWSTVASQIAGAGLTATNGVIAVDGQGAPTLVTGSASTAAVLSEGTNYMTGTLLTSLTVALPEASAPTAGDKITLKTAGGVSSTVTVTVATSGSHTIDGSDTVILESPYSSVTFQYLVSGSWGIL